MAKKRIQKSAWELRVGDLFYPLPEDAVAHTVKYKGHFVYAEAGHNLAGVYRLEFKVYVDADEWDFEVDQ